MPLYYFYISIFLAFSSQQTESKIAINILNIMTALGNVTNSKMCLIFAKTGE